MDSSDDQLIDNLTTTAVVIGRLLLTMATLGVLSALILGYPDSYLLTTTHTVSVPFAGPTSFKTVLIVLPLLLLGVRIYLEVYLSHWRKLETLRIGREVPVPDLVSPLRHPLLKGVSWLVLYPLPPAAIGLLAYQAAVFWEWAMVLASVSLVSAVFLATMAVGRRPSKLTISLSAFVLLAVAIVIDSRWGLERTFHRSFQLELANLESAVLARGDFRGADLRNASLANANLSYANLSQANMLRTDMSGATLTESDLSRANLGGANLASAVLTSADLTEATLSGANLANSILFLSDLTRAKLLRTNLSGAALDSANLTEAVLWLPPDQVDSVLLGLLDKVLPSSGDPMDFSPVGLLQSQLDAACGEGTLLPPGMTIGACTRQ